jgi:eukaryotic-like serine/threonine-protein kinase
MIGAQFGNYRVTHRLGEGGMGTVYRAVDTMLDRDVALKVLRPELARQSTLVERFRAEAVALARLRHENIAALYGLDRHGEDLMMVMEFISGETLEARVARTGPVPWQEALPIVRGALDALGHAHARGVVHRDIKPANVMVDAEGIVKVMDFGIARLMGENRQTRAGVAIGTPSYMAPEQLRGEDVDGRTDLYAVGALLFELLTGRVAFEADSDYSLMMQQLHEPPVPPSSLAPSIPKAIDGVVSRAMAKQPAGRFGTATDFSRALDAIVAETPSMTLATARDAAAAVSRRAPRDWRVYAIGGCVVAAVALFANAMRAPVPAAFTGTAADTAASVAGRADTTPAAAATVQLAVESTGPVAAAAAPARRSESVAPTVTPPATKAPVTRTVTPERTAVPRTPTRDEQKPTPNQPSQPEPTPKPAQPTREVNNDPPAEESSNRRLNAIAERCAAAIESNDASRASALLRGVSRDLLTAIGEGRITGASVGSVDGDNDGSARFAVRIAWRTAFGGNKTATARMTAQIGRSGCDVESSGGVR